MYIIDIRFYCNKKIMSSSLEKRNRRPKPWWDSRITNGDLNGSKNKNKEWEMPPEWDFEVWKYKNITYTINREWIVKWENKKELKPLLRDGMLYVTLRSKDWRRTIPVLSLMDEKFWKYFSWYSKKSKKPSKYKLVPKDWDYTNLKYNNLEYVDIYKYTKIWIIRSLIKWWIEDEVIINWCKISKNQLRKIRKDMRKEWYEDLIKESWIKISIEDYITIAYKCKYLSNEEISKITGIKEQVIKNIRYRLKKLEDENI